MAISLIIYLITFLSSLFIVKNYDKEADFKNVNLILLILFTIIPLVLISSIRHNVGTDYRSYKRIFYEIDNMSLSEVFLNKYYIFRTEPLFVLLNKISSYFFNYKSFFFFSALITNFFFVKGLMYFKDRKNIVLGVFVYLFMLFPLSFNITRQMIAMSLVFYSVKHVMNSDFKKFLFTIICASMFHNTAIIFIVFYVFSSDKLNEVKKKYIYMTMLAFPILFYYFLPIVIKHPFLFKYKKYFLFDTNINRMGIFITFFLLSIPTILYLNQFSFKERKLWYMSLTYLPIGWTMYTFTTGQRVTLYILTLFVYLIPLTISKIKDIKQKNIVLFYYIFMIISYYMLQYVILNKGETFPFGII